ncbi:MAG: hypothetical protein V4539_16540 [Bacteroidota bacterium]
MYITDLNGKQIRITNLHTAIDQSKLLIDYFESDERFRDFEESQKQYWKDVLNKLQELAKLN